MFEILRKNTISVQHMRVGDVGEFTAGGGLILCIPYPGNNRYVFLDCPNNVLKTEELFGDKVSLLPAEETFQLRSLIPCNNLILSGEQPKEIPLQELKVGQLSLCGGEFPYWKGRPVIRFGSGERDVAIFFGESSLCYCLPISYPRYTVCPLPGGSVITVEVT